MIFIYCTFKYFSCSITYSFIYFCTFIYFLYFSCLHLSCYSLFLFMFYYIFFHVLLYCISCSCNGILSLHSSAMLLISYHIISYTLHIHFLYIYFSFTFMFIPANTLEADTGNNYMYPKVLSLYETLISV